jgi:hypothetical protein
MIRNLYNLKYFQKTKPAAQAAASKGDLATQARQVAQKPSSFKLRQASGDAANNAQ